VFSTTVEKVVLADIQVGAAEATDLPVADCDMCHSGGDELSEHGAQGYEQCLVCHVDDMDEAFSQIVHETHMTSPDFLLPLGSCTMCHVGDSQNQFTSDAQQTCTSCHDPVPYMPEDHDDYVPLYAEAGVGCNSLNCHSCGDLGVFKTISETHDILPDIYVGGTLIASATQTAPVVDGEIDDGWNDATAIETLKGVTLKALYDNDNLYV
ncbi:MAG: hypothetical protein GY809_00080, partial [Planctomycetes bacterium]|nr:hypothetical protein [Planctomycetota bacterium]